MILKSPEPNRLPGCFRRSGGRSPVKTYRVREKDRQMQKKVRPLGISGAPIPHSGKGVACHESLSIFVGTKRSGNAGRHAYDFSILATALKICVKLRHYSLNSSKRAVATFSTPLQKPCRFQASTAARSSAARIAVRPASISSFER